MLVEGAAQGLGDLRLVHHLQVRPLQHEDEQLPPGDHQAIEALVRYMMRPPASLARLRLLPGEEEVLDFPKTDGEDPGSRRPEPIDATDYVARVLARIPPPRKHLVRYRGYCSNAG